MEKSQTEKERRNCPACGDTDGREAGAKNDYPLIICQSCSTLYTEQLPLSTNKDRYEDYYDEGNLTVPEFISQRLDEIVSTFSTYRSTNRLLEVGFGAVTTLQAAQRASWQTYGVEISRPAIEHARQLGFDVFEGELSEASYPDEHFDVVIASEILEHVPDPKALLTEIRRVLRPDGLLWATTPNCSGISYRALGDQWTAVCPPEHLQLFSAAGMKSLLMSSGFKRVKLQVEGTNPYELLQRLRKKRGSQRNGGEMTGTDRVEMGYALNEQFMKSPVRRAVKQFVNGVLRTTGLGDYMKIYAVK